MQFKINIMSFAILVLFVLTSCSIEVVPAAEIETSEEDSGDSVLSSSDQDFSEDESSDAELDEGFEISGVSIKAGETHYYAHKSVEGVLYKIEYGAEVGSLGLCVYASTDDDYDSLEDTNIQVSHWSDINMSNYEGDYIIVEVKAVSDATYYLEIKDASSVTFLPDDYYTEIPDSLDSKTKTILSAVHSTAFADLYKVAPYYGGTNKIYGDSGNGSVTCTGNPKRTFEASFDSYSVDGITIDGDLTWWLNIDYSYIQEPTPKAGFHHVGGGEGGTLTIGGSYNTAVDVEFEVLDQKSQNDTRFLFNEYLVIHYTIDGETVSMALPLLRTLYKRTFSHAFNDLVENFDDVSLALGGETTQEGREGGTVTWTIDIEEGSYPKKRTETIEFNDYADNGIKLNGTLSFYTLIDDSDSVLDNTLTTDGAYDFGNQTITVTGDRESSVSYSVNIFKESTTWNYSISYTVEGVSHQFPFTRISVSLGE